ncbi:hypothetical protein LRH25_03545 [Ideonella azotifigens]|uniref:Cardiolipin synthase N-terminal domain-containing protein n=1 Tax=Ideonella azotifigens TaxID=513160 RepID=A0ABP3VX95_9BURK|nr:hypothetical protein [Ideonella azotifigens]MCD2339410.1 hypothetical protein [Ideonella azotifigens]
MNTWLVLLLVGMLVGHAAWVTRIVLGNSALERQQKLAQCLLVWLLPPLSALAVHLINWGLAREPGGRGVVSSVEPQMDQGVSPPVLD